MENAKVVGWVSEMCISNETTFFSCTIKGKYMGIKCGEISLLLLIFWCSEDFVICCLQLPPPQLESALNKYANLRGPLSAFAGHPSTRATIPRYSSLYFYYDSTIFLIISETLYMKTKAPLHFDCRI